MKITYVTSYDGMGQNFNGYVLLKRLNQMNHQARMLTFERMFDEPEIIQIGSPFMHRINKSLAKLEKRLSLHSILPILSLSVVNSPEFRSSDIVHLQLLHARQFFSMLSMPMVSRKKTVVWTIHDPWITTGHCIYSMACDLWKSGCDHCPDLKIPIESEKDTCAFNWRLKKWAMKSARLQLIVASQWMYDWVKESPIMAHLPCSLIPFGIDQEVFKPTDRMASRSEWGIPEEAHVLSFRSTPHRYDFKGTPSIVEALERYQPTKPTYLITFDEIGGLDSLCGKYQLIELGWVKDQNIIQKAMNASDLFLMPSTAEAFGLMAIEAMACGLPVVVFEGTALPSVVHHGEGGWVVPYKDNTALAAAIRTLLEDDPLRIRLRESTLALARREYSLEKYTQRHLELYQNLQAK
jgi:glycosyltransferase involved in cell wall biosynthesis